MFDLRRILTVGSVLGLAIPCAASTWTETGPDAGELLGTANLTSGTNPLDQIDGTLDTPDDVDLYCITITDVTSFSASVAGINNFGVKLVLFDDSGFGVSLFTGFTPAGAQLTNTFVPSAGTYFIGISTIGPHPLDSASQGIWDPAGAFEIERAPDGIGAANSLDSWSPGTLNIINAGYSIILTGTGFHVPEPGAAALLTLGLIVAVRRRRTINQP